jgi:hypothetical protein
VCKYLVLIQVETSRNTPVLGQFLVESQFNTCIDGTSEVVVCLNRYLCMVGVLNIYPCIIGVYVFEIENSATKLA